MKILSTRINPGHKAITPIQITESTRILGLSPSGRLSYVVTDEPSPPMTIEIMCVREGEHFDGISEKYRPLFDYFALDNLAIGPTYIGSFLGDAPYNQAIYHAALLIPSDKTLMESA